MSLFADDILTITNPIITLPTLELVPAEFGALSGLQMNYAKSKALNISLQADVVATLQAEFLYPWQAASLPYLGISLTSL